ncbi:MAG TPA: lipocalin-like domain-containing protein [Actinomycetes bacterium]|jgi:hypothetical protein|nr:lipocalin-like domain-containing protein [Actinomycetes bacterium]
MGGDLAGTWRLESWTIHDQDGTVWDPLGEEGTGVAVVAAEGWLSVHITLEEPVQVAANQAATYVDYVGRYRLDGDRLVTTVEISSISDWVGTEQARDVELTADTMVLRLPTGGGVRHELRWRRIA